jgi:hypothetical protein
LVIPVDAQSSHPNLIVSAENDVGSTMTGFQVVEIVVDDPDISDTATTQTEPNVAVNGNTIRMVQAIDGKWYGYVAERSFAQFADSTVTVSGTGFDFGEFCSSSTDESVFGIDISGIDGIAIARPYSGTVSSTNGESTMQSCSGGSVTSGDVINNVVRNPPTLVSSSTIPLGQIGINSDIFPIIQLVNLNITGDVVFEYYKSTGTQSVTLRYDEFSILRIISDTNLLLYSDIDIDFEYSTFNIDPTSKDVWTFLMNSDKSSSKTYYQLFNEFGVPESDGNNPFAIKIGNLDNMGEQFIFSMECNTLDCSSIFQPQSNSFQTLTDDGNSLSLSSSQNFITMIESDNYNYRFSTLDSDGNSTITISYSELIDYIINNTIDLRSPKCYFWPKTNSSSSHYYSKLCNCT